jgi:hypothetical protein
VAPMSPWRSRKARLFPEQQVARSSRAGDTDATDRTAVPATAGARSTRAGRPCHPVVLMLWMLSLGRADGGCGANRSGVISSHYLPSSFKGLV